MTLEQLELEVKKDKALLELLMPAMTVYNHGSEAHSDLYQAAVKASRRVATNEEMVSVIKRSIVIL